ncbi:MAG: anti-phage dCTP deaminase [Pirellulaceae bacterium]
MSQPYRDYLSNDELDSELIIGLVCAVGTESGQVVELLEERLGRAGYHVETVKISRDVIPQLVNVPDCGNDRFKRYSDLMDAGNSCRRLGDENADDAILALGAATVVAAKRRQSNQNGNAQSEQGGDTLSGPLPKTAFIIDSLKRPEEVERLRIVYPSGFVLVGIHAEEDRRRKHLVDDEGMNDEQVKVLFQRDGEESKVKHGQRVNATFHLADFFVRLTNDRERLRFDIQRNVELWFGNPFITPTFDEHAMFFAFAAALRSADLSRQVGAVIARDSQILATGANECPKAGGGLYWPSGNIDKDYVEPNVGVGCARDYAFGRDYRRDDGDSNRAEQLRIIDRIIKAARQEDSTFDEKYFRTLLEKSGIKDLTEFGRVVHAEMEAILSCARNGISTVDATLYCTTFPCHNCAKHIVAAGIRRVVYVEPYPKSKALSHHDDSISASGVSLHEEADCVVFEPFVGVGPRRFFELFSMNLGSSYPLIRKVKETGQRRDWQIETAQLRLQMKPVSYLDLELLACDAFGEKAKLKPE